MKPRTALLAVLLLLHCIQTGDALCRTATAQHPARDSVADRILLKDGPAIRGLLTSERPLQLLVRSEWLNEHSPKFLADELQPLLKKNAGDSTLQLRALVQKELAAIPANATPANAPPAAAATQPNATRQALLEDLLDRLAPAADQQIPDWLLIQFPRSRVQKLEQVTDQKRELCRLGMLNRLPKLEQLPWKNVQQQLEAIPASQRITRFIGQTPGQSRNIDLLFQQILAAVDIRAGAATRVIQSGPICVDEDSPGGIPLLFQQALQQNLQSTLGELLAEASGNRPPPSGSAPQPNGSVPPEAAAIAQRQSRNTLVISHSTADLNSGSAIVNRQVFRLRDGEWRQLFALQEQAFLKDVPPDRAQQLSNDPRISEVTKIAETLGLAGNQLQTALSMGAVVQTALARLQATFDEQLQSLLTARWTTNSAVPLLVLENSPPANQP
jgi:hypothetical protein